eukprot:2628707-Alexandrium_andersonii.AAC.1
MPRHVVDLPRALRAGWRPRARFELNAPRRLGKRRQPEIATPGLASKEAQGGSTPPPVDAKQ